MQLLAGVSTENGISKVGCGSKLGYPGKCKLGLQPGGLILSQSQFLLAPVKTEKNRSPPRFPRKHWAALASVLAIATAIRVEDEDMFSFNSARTAVKEDGNGAEWEPEPDRFHES